MYARSPDLSVRMEQFGSYRADFREIWYFQDFEKISGTLHEDKCTFMIVSRLNSSYNGKFFKRNKEILCITRTVEHNYISPSSTVGIQLRVSAVYVGRLQVVI